MSVKRWTVLATRYNIVLLLTATAVYVYRDIWPLATYHQRPIDANDGLLWVKLVILTLTSLCVPLFIPRRYIPVDPKVKAFSCAHFQNVYPSSCQDPMPVPNDEQTCSLFSLAFYFYLDPVVSMGNRVKHLEADQLPPLPDTAYSKNLVNNAFPVCTPSFRVGFVKLKLMVGVSGRSSWSEETTPVLWVNDGLSSVYFTGSRVYFSYLLLRSRIHYHDLDHVSASRVRPFSLDRDKSHFEVCPCRYICFVMKLIVGSGIKKQEARKLQSGHGFGLFPWPFHIPLILSRVNGICLWSLG